MSETPSGFPAPPPSPGLPPQYAVATPPAIRGGTTALGIIALCLGGLGFFLSSMGLVGLLVNPDMFARRGGPSTGAYLIDAVLQEVPKLGLIVIGILMLLRKRAALPLAIVTFVISTIGSVFGAVAILPKTAAQAGDPPMATGVWMGAGFTWILAVGIYLTLIIYMVSAGTRREFELVGGARSSSRSEFDVTPLP